MSEDTQEEVQEDAPKKKKAVKQIAVRANKVGFFNGARRREGDIFFVPSNQTAKWFDAVDPKLADEVANADEEAALAVKRADQVAIEEKKKADEDAAEAKRAADEKAKADKADAVAQASAKKTGLARLLPGSGKAAEETDGQASASAKSPEDAIEAAKAAAASASGDAETEDDLA